MWEGYLQDEKTAAFVEYLAGRGFTEHHLHTGGHADVETLRLMVDEIQPKNLVPIHTFEADAYQNLFSTVNVRLVKDKDVVEF
jgi:ribonuclease J